MNIKEILQKVFSPEYIFDISVMVPHPTDRYYMFLGFVMVLVGVVFKVVSNFSKNPISQNLWHRLASPFVVGGILEVVWFVAREQNIKLFGSHIVAWIIGVVILIWLYFPLKYWWSKYKDEKQAWEKQQIKLKYMK